MSKRVFIACRRFVFGDDADVGPPFITIIMMSYRTYVRYLYVILSEIPHIKLRMTHYAGQLLYRFLSYYIMYSFLEAV